MISGSFSKNRELIMECMKNGEMINLCEDSFYVQFNKESKTLYLWYSKKGVNNQGKCIASYKVYSLTDYAFLPYYIQGAVDAYDDSGLPF
jgi:hypothetical protein